MKKFKVGIQLYGVRESMKVDFEGTLKAIADMGYEYVEFAGYYDRTAEEIKAMIEEDKGARTRCRFCNREYDFSSEELEKILAKK